MWGSPDGCPIVAQKDDRTGSPNPTDERGAVLRRKPMKPPTRVRRSLQELEARHAGMTDATKQRLRVGQDIDGNPCIAWQQPDGQFKCAWIERARDQPATRCLYTAQTDTLGGKIGGEIVQVKLDNDGDDLDALFDYARAQGAAEA
jgi:hypothetical protein